MYSEIFQRLYIGLIIHYVLCKESKQNLDVNKQIRKLQTK